MSSVKLLTRNSGNYRPICGYVVAGTVPKECELDQYSLEFQTLASLSQDEVTYVHSSGKDAETAEGVVSVGPPLPRYMVVWEAQRMHHPRGSRTLTRVQLDWYWPEISANRRILVRTCEVCQSRKYGAAASSEHRQHLFATRPWQVLSVDLESPFTTTQKGDTTILVLSNHFTRWRYAIALPNGTAEVMAEALQYQVLCYLGVSKRIHTDQGAQFE